LRPSITLVIVGFVILTLIISVTHYQLFQFEQRTKGFGSGTLYAVYSVTCILYFLNLYKVGRLGKLPLMFLVASLIFVLLLTQSRGAILSLVVALTIANFETLRAFGRYIGGASVVVACGIFLTVVSDVTLPILNRFNSSRFDSFNQFTSGRATVQIEILNWIRNEDNPLNIFLGREGLGGVKSLVYSQQFEMPHFDFLYILYDSGLYGVGLYLALIVFLLRKTPRWDYISIYLVSSLHTNMIVSPHFLIFLILLTFLDHSGRTGRLPKLSRETLLVKSVRHRTGSPPAQNRTGQKAVD
jgi:hypothetical protein